MLQNTINVPDFILDVANGPSVTLSELWREHYLLLWLSRGLACPFCRRQIMQLTQIQDEIQNQNTQVILIAHTELEQARSMLQYYPVPWPYACDPGRRAATAYGFDAPQGPLAGMVSNLKEQSRAWRVLLQHPGEPHPEVLPAVKAAGHPAAANGGMVIIDRSGQVRFRLASGKLALLPANDIILGALRQVVGAGP
ncbi:MAG: redoxin domain-containing protein [Anaerolineales bacterium]|nr:MAG: redoxin domain-containing protein [Anaerolineales bacterium]